MTRHFRMSRTLPAVVFWLLTTATTVAVAESAGAPVALTLPAQPLSQSVTDLARQAGWTLGGRGDLLQGKQAPALEGRYRPETALRRLLAGSGVTYELTDTGTIRLVAVSQGDAERLAPITVADDRWRQPGQTEGRIAYSTDTATIGKTDQAIKDIPQSVSVVTRTQIEDWQLEDLAATIDQVTGVTVREFGGDQFEIASRGYVIDSYLLDGAPVANGGGSWESNGLFDMALYDRVEVLRGPAGMLQGAGEPAGAVNLVRKRAQAQTALNTSLTVGSWNTYRGVVDVTGALDDSERLRGRLIAAYDDRNSFVDKVYARNLTLYGTLEYDLTDQATVSAGITHQTKKARPHSGLPVSGDGSLLDVSQSTFLGSDWDRLDGDSQRYFAELDYVLDNGGLVTLKANRVKRDTEIYKSSEATTPVDPTTGTVPVRRIHSDNPNTDDYLEVQLETPFEAFGRSHVGVIGASYQNSENFFPYDYADPRNVIRDVNRPDHDNSEPAFGNAPGFTSFNINEYAGYGQVRAKIVEPLTLTLGARVSRWQTDNESSYAGATGAEDTELVPSAGFIYALSPEINAYASYSTIFQPQTATGRDGELIEPREGAQIEAGLKGEGRDGLLNWHIAAFRIDDENRAIADPLRPGVSVPLGEARSRGMIAEIAGTVWPRLNITAGYAYTDTEFTRDPANEGLALSPETPKHDFSLWTRYEFNDDPDHGWRIGAGVHTRSGTYLENTQAGVRIEQGGYTTYDAMAGYRWNRQLDFSLTGKNLTDKKYYSTLGGFNRHNYYGEPRSVFATVRYRYD